MKHKRRHGPEPKPASKRRWHAIGTRLTDAELAIVDGRRGNLTRGEWLRKSALGQPVPAQIPRVNLEAWRELARTAANLNQIARRLNSGEAIEAEHIRQVLAEFRTHLIGMQIEEETDHAEYA